MPFSFENSASRSHHIIDQAVEHPWISAAASFGIGKLFEVIGFHKLAAISAFAAGAFAVKGVWDFATRPRAAAHV